MGKGSSKHKELEEKFVEERDKLFDEFLHAKEEIQRKFDHQTEALENKFKTQVQRLQYAHEEQLMTLKLQLRDSQLIKYQELMECKRKRYMSWPMETDHGSVLNFPVIDNSAHAPQNQNMDVWQGLVENLKLALKRQKHSFEMTMMEDKLKLQRQLEAERTMMEENLFKRLNNTLKEALRERDSLVNETALLQNISTNIFTNSRISGRRRKGAPERSGYDSGDEVDTSADSGVDENSKKVDRKGNYWRTKYFDAQRKFLRKIQETEQIHNERERLLTESFEERKRELKQQHFDELNDVQIISARELQKLLKEERDMQKDLIRELNGKIIQLSNENEQLKERVETLDNFVGGDVLYIQHEMTEKLLVLKTILEQEEKQC